MIKDQLPALSRGFSKDFGYDRRKRAGPKMMLEAELGDGYYLCFLGSVLAFGAALEALRTHYPHAFDHGGAAVAPVDAKDGGA